MSNEIIKKEASLPEIPEYLKEFENAGMEDITPDMVEKSFLQMAHEDKKEGVKLGEWFDSNTFKSFGKEVVVTVCKISRTWRKFNSDFKLEAYSTDGIHWDNGDKLADDEKWKNAFIDMFVILNDHLSGIPYIVSFKSTSFKIGKKLSTTIAKFATANREPIFARNYTLYTEITKKGAKEYSLAKYKLNSGFNSKEVMETASNVRKMVDGVDITKSVGQDNEPNFDFSDDSID